MRRARRARRRRRRPARAPRRDGALRRSDEVALALARRLLADAWVVDDLDRLPPAFAGVAVTARRRAWFGVTRELRQAPRGGGERVLERAQPP